MIETNVETGIRPKRRLWEWLGPGLITGASDDDPSGIATYSQVGAQFGFGMAWVMLKTMRISGAESMNVAASIFMGQTEAPLTIRPSLEPASISTAWATGTPLPAS